MNKSKLTTIIFLSIFLYLPMALNAHVPTVTYIIFRDAVYLQNANLPETMRLYAAAKQEIEQSFTGADMYLALSRCEALMGVTFKAAGKDNEAASYFEQGIAWAERSLALQPTSNGYLLLGSNISFLCEVRPSYGMRNIGKIEENAIKALELDPNNLMAKHLIASRYILAPWPFANIRKGVAILEEITSQNYMILERDDLFSLYLLLEAANLKQRKNQEAQIWRDKAAAIYPGNNFISLLMNIR